jgi:hypothetical protein
VTCEWLRRYESSRRHLLADDLALMAGIDEEVLTGPASTAEPFIHHVALPSGDPVLALAQRPALELDSGPDVALPAPARLEGGTQGIDSLSVNAHIQQQSGSGGRTRTYDQAVNSRPLYH